MSGWSLRQIAALMFVLVALFAAVAVAAWRKGVLAGDEFVVEPRRPPAEAPAIPPPSPARPSETAAPARAEAIVHVAGAVNKPGVFHLKVGARANDAIAAAGGPRKDANLDALNLAAVVEDGQQLYVPTRAEMPSGGACPQPGAARASTGGAAHAGASSGAAKKLSRPGEGTVNLNSASGKELQRLPGIGPAMAERIVEYRKTNGRFTAPDQLMDVSGIGPKKYEKMRPFVRVK